MTIDDDDDDVLQHTKQPNLTGGSWEGVCFQGRLPFKVVNDC